MSQTYKNCKYVLDVPFSGRLCPMSRPMTILHTSTGVTENSNYGTALDYIGLFSSDDFILFTFEVNYSKAGSGIGFR